MHAAGRLRRLLSTGIAAVTATAALLAMQATPASADTPAIGWSMHVGPATPLPDRDNRSYITDMESQIGRSLAYDTRYDIFGKDQVITDRERWAQSVGKTPFIHLNMGACFTPGCKARPTWAQVAKGSYDNYLKQQAAALIAYGSPVIFNYGNESNLKSQSRGTPTDFKNAWNHIVSVFRAAGVNNVTYALTLTNGVYDQGNGMVWYPGDNTVDAIAPTGYNWACTPGHPNFGKLSCAKTWRTFKQVFNSSYAFATAHGKKLLISETGTAEDPGKPGRKAQWILDMGATAKSWPSLMGIVWFQAGKRVDYWNINSSLSSFLAYRCVGNDPAFGGTGSTCTGT
jgi:hypothetical protein